MDNLGCRSANSQLSYRFWVVVCRLFNDERATARSSLNSSRLMV
jgi:hypothetical protein